MLPKPLHSGQAPSGWLNEKSSGCGRVEGDVSQPGHRNSRLHRDQRPGRSRPPRPGPRLRPARPRGTRVSRRRDSGPSTTRSSTTASGCPGSGAGRAAGRPAASARSTDLVADLDPREAAAGVAAATGRLRVHADGGRAGGSTRGRARRGGLASRASVTVVRGVAPRLASAARAVDAADRREEQAKVVVELGGRAHRGAGRAHGVLLLQRDGGPDVLDPVHVGPVHAVEEHAGVGGQGLDVPPLALGEEGVEGERGFSGARHAGDHGHRGRAGWRGTRS